MKQGTTSVVPRKTRQSLISLLRGRRHGKREYPSTIERTFEFPLWNGRLVRRGRRSRSRMSHELIRPVHPPPPGLVPPRSQVSLSSAVRGGLFMSNRLVSSSELCWNPAVARPSQSVVSSTVARKSRFGITRQRARRWLVAVLCSTATACAGAATQPTTTTPVSGNGNPFGLACSRGGYRDLRHLQPHRHGDLY